MIIYVKCYRLLQEIDNEHFGMIMNQRSIRNDIPEYGYIFKSIESEMRFEWNNQFEKWT